MLDLLGSELHQILVDDVADVFEIYREGDYFDGVLAVPLVKAFTGYLCHTGMKTAQVLLVWR